MTVELLEMRWAVTVSQHRSLYRAAETLQVRQSTPSRRMQDLEHRLGAKLFERTNGGICPTVVGLEFFELARRILEDTDAALRNLRARSRGENGRLTIGIYASLATGNMLAALADYHCRLPEVGVHTVDGCHSRLICAFARNAVGLAIMTTCRSGWHGGVPPLWTERVIVALPEHHPLAEYAAVSWRLLANERLVTTRTGASVGKMLAAKLNGDRPKRVLHQEARLDRLLSLVSTGYGVLLMLEGGAGLKQEGVVYREIREGTEPTRLSFMAYW